MAVVAATSQALVLRSQRTVFAAPIHQPFDGPGRTIHEAYEALGNLAQRYANRAGHLLGLGPVALIERIHGFFGVGTHRERKLDELRRGDVDPELGAAAKRLVRYILPSEAARTQMDCFKGIAVLTTMYPGLRRVFVAGLGAYRLSSDAELRAEEFISICKQRDDVLDGLAQFTFYLKLACAALTDRRRCGGGSGTVGCR
ncbi:hypothetical protein MKEN_01312700 [Mycena kentingensis (nom. inval.)]|nr:hypothetical protein MKEN_01312700 [Mycena kentingensis (nom. inval.)]